MKEKGGGQKATTLFHLKHTNGRHQTAILKTVKRKLFSSLFFVLFIFNFSHAAESKLLGANCEKETEKNKVDPNDDNVINIIYMGSDSAPYGKTASANPKPFQNIIFHDPGSNNCEPINMVKYGQIYDSSRGGSFGYHFYIAQDGQIYQGAPLNKRTNHTDPDNRRSGFSGSAQNNNSIGVTLMCGSKDITAKQTKSSNKLSDALRVAYGISVNNLYGHGEIQTTRTRTEGMKAKAAAQGSSPKNSVTVRYIINNGEVVICKIDGRVPDNCTGDYCGQISPGQKFNKTPSDYFKSFFQNPSKIPTDAQDYGYPLIQNDQFKNMNSPQGQSGQNQNPFMPQQKNNSSNPYLGNQQNPYINQNQSNQNSTCTQSDLDSLSSDLRSFISNYNKKYLKYGKWNEVDSVSGFSPDLLMAKIQAKLIKLKVNSAKACGYNVVVQTNSSTDKY